MLFITPLFFFFTFGPKVSDCAILSSEVSTEPILSSEVEC